MHPDPLLCVYSRSTRPLPPPRTKKVVRAVSEGRGLTKGSGRSSSGPLFTPEFPRRTLSGNLVNRGNPPPTHL